MLSKSYQLICLDKDRYNLMSLTLVNSSHHTHKKEPSTAVIQGSQWRAFLHLGLALTKRGVVLKMCEHKGPLYVQKPFYPEGKDLAHLYILHPPGGLVSGDHLTLRSTQDKGAHSLITTPGAGRVYKARSDKSLQSQANHFIVGENASLEWLPQETIIYPDARTKLDTIVDLNKNAHFIGWEISCFGLPASQQTFDKGEVKQTLEIRQQGKIKLRERIIINQEKLTLFKQLAGFNQQNVNAFMVAGPFLNQNDFDDDSPLGSLIRLIQADCEDINMQEGQAMASVSLTGDFLLIRYLGRSSEQAKNLFIACWQKIRPQLIQRDACLPRIWAT